MIKKKYLFIIILFFITILVIPNNSSATVESTRVFKNVGGDFTLNLSGLTLDTTHEYQYGFTRTTANEVENWIDVVDFTDTTISLDTDNYYIHKIAELTNTGYLTIKDITNDTIALENYPVDLTPDLLKLINCTTVNNGQRLSTFEWNCGFYTSRINSAQYQYVKITDQNVISKFEEIKQSDGDIYEMSDMLSKEPPTSGWKDWETWVYSGGGHPETIVKTPDSGLYYMWLKFEGSGIKDIYAYVLVDALENEIPLQSISLPSTATIELGKNITLNLVYNPSNTTEKEVVWSSSNESVATVDNNGKVTPVKVGTTIITVKSEDGSKSANCTVTVTNPTENNNDNNVGEEGKNDGKDETVAPKPIPQTGEGIALIILASLTILGLVIAYIKESKFKDIN